MAASDDYPLRTEIGLEDELVLREATGGNVFRSDGSPYRAKASTLQNQLAAAVTGDVSALLTVNPTFTDLAAQVAANTAALGAFSTQNSVIDIRPVSGVSTDSTTAILDTWAANPADTRNNGDQITYTASHTLTYTSAATLTDKTSVVITTVSGNSTITATSGTFLTTDTGRLIVAAGIPANTYLVFVSSTSATLRDADKVAVTASASAAGVTTVISFPPFVIGALFKINNINVISTSISLPVTASGVYLSNFDYTHTQGVDATHSIREGHWRITNNGVGSTSSPINGLLYDMTWRSNDATNNFLTTRPIYDFRLTPTFASPSWTITRDQSVMYSIRNP